MVRSNTGYFYRWARARAELRRIQQTLSAGGAVIAGTALRATQYGPAHASMFQATPSGLYFTGGRRRVCLTYCTFRYFT